MIGGGGGTERTAYALLAAGARLIPFASFGGAAELVLAEATATTTRHATRDSLVGVLEELGVDRALIMGLEQLPGETLPEKWETVAAQAEAAIVLATPDDEGRVRGETTLRARARENVWLELGWLWGRLLERRRLLLLIRDADDEAIEIPSDYSGVVFEKFKEDPGDSRKAIAAFIDQLRRHLAE